MGDRTQSRSKMKADNCLSGLRVGLRYVSDICGELRYPSMVNILICYKQPIQVWEAEDFRIETSRLRKRGIMQLIPPKDMRRTVVL